MAVGNASSAKDVIQLYAEGSRDLEGGDRPQHVQVIGEDQQKDLEINDAQRKALNESLGDGVISTQERAKLTGAGFSDEFINELAGGDGQAALRKRVTWLGEHVGSSIWGGPSVTDRFRNAMELSRAQRDLSASSNTSDEVQEALAEGAKGTRELEKDLSKIAKVDVDSTASSEKEDKARTEAITRLGALGTPEATKALLKAIDNPAHAMHMPELVRALENASGKERGKAIDKLVDIMENKSQSYLKQDAIATLNTLSLKAVNEGTMDAQVLWAHEHLKKFAQDPQQNSDLRLYAMVALANSGVSSIAPDLQAISGRGSKPETLALAEKSPQDLVGPRPDRFKMEKADFEAANSKWESLRAKAETKINAAKQAVGDGITAQEALQRMRIQLQASTLSDPSHLKTSGTEFEIPRASPLSS